MVDHNLICPILLAGGNGVRLSPISTARRPKQFIPLKDSQSLFEKTKIRFSNSEIYTKPIVIGNIAHRGLLKDTGDEHLVTLFEPIAKNTAAACMISCLAAIEFTNAEFLCFAPTDHIIKTQDQFQEDIQALKASLSDNDIGIFGIPPTQPKTDFGYFQTDNTNYVTRFIEKPNIQTAQKLIASGNTFWNAGIILVKKSVFWQWCERLEPDLSKK